LDTTLFLIPTTQEVGEKWKGAKIRDWSDIYPQLSIFFSEIMQKYTKWL